MNVAFLVAAIVWFAGYWGFSLLASQETVREGRARGVLEARMGGKWLGNTSPRGKAWRNFAIAWVIVPVLIVGTIVLVAVARGGFQR